MHEPFVEILLFVRFAAATSVMFMQHNKTHLQSPTYITTNGDTVDLTLTYIDRNRLRLRCDAKGIGAKESLVLLDCPAVHTGVCKQNCLSPCPIVNGVPKCRWNTNSPIKSCRQIIRSADRLVFEYDIELSSDTTAGHWKCTFRGRSSNSIRIAYQPLDSVTAVSIPTEPSKTMYITNASTTTGPVNPAGGLHSVVNLEFVTQLPFEVLLFILTLACLSIMFNLWFLIRYSRMKVYLRGVRKDSPKCTWLDQLACVHPPIKWEDRYFSTEWKPILYPYASSPLSGPCTVGIPRVTTHIPNTPYVQSTNTCTTETQLLGSHRMGLTRQPDAIYDDVHNSVYAFSLNRPGRRRGVEQLQPVSAVVTYDGQEWVLDHSGQFYLPYELRTSPRPVYERQSCMPLAAPDLVEPYGMRSGARAPTPCPLEQTQYYSNAAPPLPNRPQNGGSFAISKTGLVPHKLVASAETPNKQFDSVNTVSLVTRKPAYTEPKMCSTPTKLLVSSQSVIHGQHPATVTTTEQSVKTTSPSAEADAVVDDSAQCLPPRTQELIKKGPKNYLEEWTFSD